MCVVLFLFVCFVWLKSDVLSRLIVGLAVCVCVSPNGKFKERQKQLDLRTSHLDMKENRLACMQDELEVAAEEQETRWRSRDLHAIVEPWLKRLTIPSVSAVSAKGWTPLHVVVERLRVVLLELIELMKFRWSQSQHTSL